MGTPYHQIEKDLRQKIRSAYWKSGEQIPSRKQLARDYGVAVATIERAVSALLQDGTLYSDDRRGTFIGDQSAKTPVGAGADAKRSDFHPAVGIGQLPGILPVPTGRLHRLSGTVGVIVQIEEGEAWFSLGGNWAQTALRSFEYTLAKTSIRTPIFNRSDPGRVVVPVVQSVEAMLASKVDALVIINISQTPDLESDLLAVVDTRATPTVMVSWEHENTYFAHVYYDQRNGGYVAGQHLIEAGYRRLLFIAPFVERWLQDRIEGMRASVIQAGLPLDSLCVDDRLASGAMPLREVRKELSVRATGLVFDEYAERIRDNPGIYAVVAPHDDAALDAMQAALSHGLVPGSDVGILGFDDDGRSTFRGLTSVRPPLEAMGEATGQIILRALSGAEWNYQISLRSQVIPRASTKR